MLTPTGSLLSNPLPNILTTVKQWSVKKDYGLERTYTLSKSNKILGLLRAEPGHNEDLEKIDHNKVLDAYPEYEYIFGPYNDSNEHEFNQVYFLYTNRINDYNELKVVYAARVLMLHLGTAVTPDQADAGALDVEWYRDTVAQLPVVPDRKSLYCYYKPYFFSEQEMRELKAIYGCSAVSQPRYNPIRENYVVSLSGKIKTMGANPFRLLYELYHAKAKLPEHIVTSPKNGKKADVRIDNVVMRDLVAEDLARREEALNVYGLDTYKLEKIMAPTGFNRFRGIYTYDGPTVIPSNKGRRYIKVVKDGTDLQDTMLLSRALMTVKLGRQLLTDETVDHIDHDHCNDAMSNLRIMSKAAHVSADSIRVDVAPVSCCMCGKTFRLNIKQYGYYKLSDAPVTCSPGCKSELRKLPLDKKVELNAQKVINYRYYVVDKLSGEWLYFDSLDYDECRQLLYKYGKPKPPVLT